MSACPDVPCKAFHDACQKHSCSAAVSPCQGHLLGADARHRNRGHISSRTATRHAPKLTAQIHHHFLSSRTPWPCSTAHLLGDVGKVAQLPVPDLGGDPQAHQQGPYVGDYHQHHSGSQRSGHGLVGPRHLPRQRAHRVPVVQVPTGRLLGSASLGVYWYLCCQRMQQPVERPCRTGSVLRMRLGSACMPPRC